MKGIARFPDTAEPGALDFQTLDQKKYIEQWIICNLQIFATSGLQNGLNQKILQIHKVSVGQIFGPRHLALNF